ncbi:hypothetical protein Tco_1404611 [Tanacetum coccineum]
MWLRINLISSRRTRKGLLDLNGGRCGGIGGRGGSMARRGGGWLARRSIVSKEGCSGGRLVVRGGKSSSELKNREIPSEVIGEKGGDTIGLDGGVVCMVKWSAGSICIMEPTFVNEGNRLSVVDNKQWCLDEVKEWRMGFLLRSMAPLLSQRTSNGYSKKDKNEAKLDKTEHEIRRA